MKDDVVTVIRAQAKMDGTESADTQASMMAAHVGIRDFGLLLTSIEKDNNGKPAYIVSYWEAEHHGELKKLNQGERFVDIPKVFYEALKAAADQTTSSTANDHFQTRSQTR